MHLSRGVGCFKQKTAYEMRISDWISDVCSSDLPAIAARLQARKVANVESTRPDVVATGNIGCITRFAAATDLPVVHTVELLDWATGGPLPPALASKAG